MARLPEQISWRRTSGWSTMPGFLSGVDLMQRTKRPLADSSVVMSCFNDSPKVPEIVRAPFFLSSPSFFSGYRMRMVSEVLFSSCS